MYISAATLLAADPSGAEEHTYTEIVDAIRVRGAEAQADIEELWRRIAFSILVTNVDRTRELKTWVSPETGPEATISALLSVTAYFRIPTTRAKAILREVEQTVAKWRAAGKKLGMTAHELEAFADAFEHPERAAARQLSAQVRSNRV